MLSNAPWKYRHAALSAISIIGEGGYVVISAHLSQVMDLVLPYMNDPHERVRWAACNTIGQMSIDFGPQLQAQHHDRIIPLLLNLIKDNKCPRLQSHSAAAIVNFCEKSTCEILKPYVPELLENLSNLIKLQNPLSLENAITAIAAIAKSIQREFIPVLNYFISLLIIILFL